MTAEPCTTLLYPLSIKSPAFQNDSFFPFWTIQQRAYGFALLLKLHSLPP